MADSRQFGSPKVSQFGDKTPGNQPGDSGHCAQCEAMLADALDGTLSSADQNLFDVHMAHCGPCSQLLADARRGAAFLEMLRNPPPEPPADLLEKILAQTSGANVAAAHAALQALPGAAIASFPAVDGSPGLASGYATPGLASTFGKVIPFRSRVAAAVRSSSFGQIAFQPRLAMTAAMAFFSIALTMNLTGIHPLELRASDLRPGSLKRDFYSANARVVQYYEGLRVVYELESRVHDLESTSDNGAPAGNQSAPPAGSQTGSPNSSPGPGGPAGPAPAAKPGQSGPTKPNSAPRPDEKQRPPASGPASGPATSPNLRPAPNSRTSRRVGFGRALEFAAAIGRDRQPAGPVDAIDANINAIPASFSNERMEGTLV